MAQKYWNIVKANARIEEIESQLVAVTKERDDARADASCNDGEVDIQFQAALKDSSENKARAAQLASDLTTARASIASQAKEIETLKTSLAAKDEEVKTKVARQAVETQAQLGQPGLPSIPDGAKANANAGGNRTGMARILAQAKSDLDSAGYQRKN